MSSNSSSRSNRRSNGNGSTPKKTSPKRLFLDLCSSLCTHRSRWWLWVHKCHVIYLPDVSNVRPSASSQIYDVHGNLITTVHSSENRLPIPLKDVPKDLQNAFVATEDSRFYTHHGIDPIGILRAVWVNIVHSGVSEVVPQSLNS